jgi:hypothetical protein
MIITYIPIAIEEFGKANFKLLYDLQPFPHALSIGLLQFSERDPIQRAQTPFLLYRRTQSLNLHTHSSLFVPNYPQTWETGVNLTPLDLLLFMSTPRLTVSTARLRLVTTK